jgi:hypothetical protein
MLDSRGGGGADVGGDRYNSQASQSQAPAATSAGDVGGDFDDDIPF